MQDDVALPFLLQISLSTAVPLKIGTLEEMRPERRSSLDDDVPCEWCGPGTFDLIAKSCRSARADCKMCEGRGVLPRKRRNGQLIAERGDIILYKSKRKGDTAKMFNVLVESLAMLAFQPGGVTLAGMHFRASTEWPTASVTELADSLKQTFARRIRKVVR